MPFERTEHEPEEYDPEADLRDPTTDSLTIPNVETDVTSSDVPAEIQQTFWVLVLVLKGALMLSSVGALMLIFGYDTTTSVGLLVGGVTLFALAGRRYQNFRLSSPDDLESDTSTSDAVVETTSDTDSDSDSRSDSGPETDSTTDQESSKTDSLDQ